MPLVPVHSADLLRAPIQLGEVAQIGKAAGTSAGVRANVLLAEATPGGLDGLEIPSGMERAFWIGLSSSPGFEYWGWWWEMGPAEIATLVENFRFFAGLGYHPPIMSEHDPNTAGRRLGAIRDLKSWTEPARADGLPPRTWLVGLTQWTPAGWQALQDGDFEWVSPGYGYETDSQGNWRDLCVQELSTATRPLQKHIQSLQTWATRAGVQLSGEIEMATREMATRQKGKAAQTAPESVTAAAAPVKAAVVTLETIAEDLAKMSGAVGELTTVIQGIRSVVESNTARIQAMEDGKEPEEEPEVEEEESEAMEDEDEEAEAASASSATIARLRHERDAALCAAELAPRVGHVLQLSAADAAWLSRIPAAERAALLTRASAPAGGSPFGVQISGGAGKRAAKPSAASEEAAEAMRDRLYGEALASQAANPKLRLDDEYERRLKAAGLI